MKLSNTLNESNNEDGNNEIKVDDNNIDNSYIIRSETYKHGLESLILMLFPMAPHFASEMWNILKRKDQNDTQVKIILINLKKIQILIN